jgi:hypothetical protein
LALVRHKKDGTPTQENFKTESEAKTARVNREREDDNLAPITMVQTPLKAEQLDYGQWAYDLLRHNGKLDSRTVLLTAAYYVENFRPPDRETTVQDARRQVPSPTFADSK